MQRKKESGEIHRSEETDLVVQMLYNAFRTYSVGSLNIWCVWAERIETELLSLVFFSLFGFYSFHCVFVSIIDSNTVQENMELYQDE